MAKIIQRAANPAHGSIDLTVEDVFDNVSHHSMHLGSTKPCPECGHHELHKGVDDIDSAEAYVLDMVDQADMLKISGFEKKGFDMSAAREKRRSHQEAGNEQSNNVK